MVRLLARRENNASATDAISHWGSIQARQLPNRTSLACSPLCLALEVYSVSSNSDLFFPIKEVGFLLVRWKAAIMGSIWRRLYTVDSWLVPEHCLDESVIQGSRVEMRLQDDK